MKKNLMGKTLAAILTLALVSGCGSASQSGNGGNANPANGTDNGGSVGQEASNEAGQVSTFTAEQLKANFQVGINSDIGDISPFGSSSTGRTYAKYAIYENLIQFSEFGQNVEEMDRQIAKTVTVIDDVTADVEIYDYVHDSAGNPITADDIKFCYEMCIESGNYPKLSINMESVEVTGDYTLRFKFKKGQIGVMEYVLGQVPIVSKAAYEASSDGMLNAPISTAPYQVKELSAGSYLVLEKNENYWQTDESVRTYMATQDFDQITLNVIKENSQMSIGLETGTIAASTSIGGDEISRFMNDDGTPVPGYNVRSEYGGLATWLCLNSSDQSPLGNLELRKAVLYAIDSDAIVQGALNGKGRRVGTMGTPVCPDYKDEWEDDYYNYDLDKAKECFEASGFSSGEVTLRIMTQNTSAHNKAAEIMQAYLGQIGIKCEILAYDSALYNSYKYDPSQYDIKIDQSGTNDYVADLFVNLLDYVNGGVIPDQEVITRLETALNLSTFGEESTQELHDYVKDNAYAYGVYVSDSYTVSADKIEMVRHPWGQLMSGACRLKE